MKKQVSYILSGFLFVTLGTLMTGLGFGGVVLLGKVTSVLTGSGTSTFIQLLFTVIYGSYLVTLCWLTGKYIVPRYQKN